MAIKIAIANQKGGIGKTTTAINLACGLKKSRKKVLFVDTDAQRNSTRVYRAQIEGQATLADIMYDEADATECIQHTEMGDIIASDDALKTADTSIPVDAGRFYHLAEAMESIEDQYDFIVFDTPPGNGVLLGNVLTYVDYVIIPVTCDSFGIQGVKDFYETIQSFQKRVNKGLKIAGILRVMYKGRQSLTQDIEDNILPKFADELDTKLFKTTIRESVKCREAQTLRVSLLDYKPDSTTATDYVAFTKEFLKTIGGK